MPNFARGNQFMRTLKSAVSAYLNTLSGKDLMRVYYCSGIVDGVLDGLPFTLYDLITDPLTPERRSAIIEDLSDYISMYGTELFMTKRVSEITEEIQKISDRIDNT